MNRYIIGNDVQPAAMAEGLGCLPVGQVILAPIGTTNYSDTALRSKLSKTVVDGVQVRLPVVWFMPGIDQLVAGKVDIVNLPNHPSVAQAWLAIREYGFPVEVVTGESCNKFAGPTGAWLWVSPEVWRTVFRAIHTHPGKPGNARSWWSYAPGAQVNLDEWNPGDDVWVGMDITLLGANPVTPSSTSGKLAVAASAYCKKHEKLLIATQVGHKSVDGPLVTADDQLAAWKKWGLPFMEFAAKQNLRAVSFWSYLPNPQTGAGAYGISDWIKAEALTKPLRKKLEHPDWIKAPLIAVPAMEDA